MDIFACSLCAEPEYIAVGERMCSCAYLKVAYLFAIVPLDYCLQALLAYQSWVIWAPIPWVAAIKIETPDG